ncbi:hypothetical protein ACH4UT_34325 [Streptomyces sp. NPDC020799]|uniref:hypothetical protein n=1 Tax=Streptomyces sp. NPDC020799 TaxID=3365091 RepID=UPI0037897DAA
MEDAPGLDKLALQLDACALDVLLDQPVVQRVVAPPIGRWVDLQLHEQRVDQPEACGEDGPNLGNVMNAAVCDAIARVCDRPEGLLVNRNPVAKDLAHSVMGFDEADCFRPAHGHGHIRAMARSMKQ